jgi:hypothetical protein
MVAAPLAVVAAPVATGSSGSDSGDLVRSYLRDIGRVPLLTHEQEITLGRQVQELVALEEIEAELEMRTGAKPSAADVADAAGLTPALLKRRLQAGRRAKERMVAANLRLVVSVAKKYTKRNMELLDLIQEGTIGLVRGVEKFDPTRGYKLLVDPSGHHPRDRREKPHDPPADPHHRNPQQAEERSARPLPAAGPHPHAHRTGRSGRAAGRRGQRFALPCPPARLPGDQGGRWRRHRAARPAGRRW